MGIINPTAQFYVKDPGDSFNRSLVVPVGFAPLIRQSPQLC